MTELLWRVRSKRIASRVVVLSLVSIVATLAVTRPTPLSNAAVRLDESVPTENVLLLLLLLLR